jgi:DNA/RNA endonuclease YhcR with UshA esterase domain
LQEVPFKIRCNCCFDKTVHGTGLFKIGDSVTVTGTRSTFTGQVQISPMLP